MNQAKKKKSIWKKLRQRYQFNVLNEENYEVKSVLSLSMLNIVIWSGMLLLIVGLLSFFLISFTPLKQYIPGYGKINARQMAVKHQMLVDSLELRAEQNNMKLQIIEKVLQGNFDTTIQAEDLFTNNYDSLEIYSSSREDSMLRLDVEKRERFSIFSEEEEIVKSIRDLLIFPPLKGVVSDSFGQDEHHYGIDIISNNSKDVKSILDGTVFLAEFSIETGYIIGIHHADDLISIYKHNAKLNKKVGNFITQGEVIATAGNTGELSTGPHLHFEMWYKGEPVNPMRYINFD